MASVQHSPLNQISQRHPVCLEVVRVLASQFISLHRYLQPCWDWSCVPHEHNSRAEKETFDPLMTGVWYLGWPDHWRGWETGADGSSFCESPPLSAACCFSPGDFPWHHYHPHQLCSAHTFLGEKPNDPGMHLLQDGLKCTLTVPLDHARLCRAKPCAVQGHSWSEVQADPHYGLQDNCIVTKPQAWLSNSVDRLGVSTLPSKGCLFAGLWQAHGQSRALLAAAAVVAEDKKENRLWDWHCFVCHANSSVSSSGSLHWDQRRDRPDLLMTQVVTLNQACSAPVLRPWNWMRAKLLSG